MVDKNTIFMSSMLVIGLIFFYMASRVRSEIQAQCDSDKIRNATTGVMITATILIMASISYFVCVSKCGSGCGDTEMYSMAYSSFALLLGIVMIVLGSIISAESKGPCTATAAGGIWQLGVVIIIASLVSLYMDVSGDVKRALLSKPKESSVEMAFSRFRSPKMRM